MGRFARILHSIGDNVLDNSYLQLNKNMIAFYTLLQCVSPWAATQG